VTYDQKCILEYTQSTSDRRQVVMKLEFSRRIFEKRSNIKFHENPSSGSGVGPWKRTDGHDKANSHFRNFVNATKMKGDMF